MKFKRLITLLVLLPMYGTLAQGIEFHQGTLDEAKEKAKEEDKIIFVDAYTTWCGPCKYMSANIFPDEEVGKFYNDNFISLKLDMEKEGDGLSFRKEYKIRAFPTLLYIDGNGKLMHQVVGGMDSEKFIAAGKIALDPEVRFASFEDKYNNGNRDPEFIRSYLNALSSAYLDYKEVADWYFYTQSEADLLSKENFEVISKVVSGTDHPVFKFVLNNYDKYKTLAGAESVDKFVSGTFSTALGSAIRKGEEAYQQVVGEIRGSGNPNAEKAIAQTENQRSLNAKNYDEFAAKAKHYLRTYEWENAEYLNHYAKLIIRIEEITDKDIIAEAIAWSERAIELDNSYANNHTYATLLFKSGKGKKALKVANTALTMAEKEGSDTKGAVSLIEKIKGV